MLSFDKRSPYKPNILGIAKAPASQTVKPSFVTSHYRPDIAATEVVYRLYDHEMARLSNEFYVDSKEMMREALREAFRAKALYPFNKMQRAVERFKLWLVKGKL